MAKSGPERVAKHSKSPGNGLSAIGARIPYGEIRTGRFAEFQYYPAVGRVMCDGVTLTLENGPQRERVRSVPKAS